MIEITKKEMDLDNIDYPLLMTTPERDCLFFITSKSKKGYAGTILDEGVQATTDSFREDLIPYNGSVTLNNS